MTGGPGELPDGHLSIVVFGPGYGESLVVRLPHGGWLVVDSLRDSGEERNPALELIRNHGARIEAVALTHPHDDHAGGFADLLSILDGPGSRVGAVASAGVVETIDPLHDPDAAGALRRSRTRLALSAIQARWDLDPASAWHLESGADIVLGDVEVDVLTPRADLLGRASIHPNQLSAAMALRWHDLRIVLGADVPTGEWNRVDHAVDLGEHALMKVSHHGSKRSQHDRLSTRPDHHRVWILAPWTRAGRHLPRLDEGEDLARLLQRVPRVEITSSPVALTSRAERPIDRSLLHQLGARSTFGGGDLILEYDNHPPSSCTAWVAAVLDATGDLVDLRHGDAALSVIP